MITITRWVPCDWCGKGVFLEGSSIIGSTWSGIFDASIISKHNRRNISCTLFQKKHFHPNGSSKSFSHHVHTIFPKNQCTKRLASPRCCAIGRTDLYSAIEGTRDALGGSLCVSFRVLKYDVLHLVCLQGSYLKKVSGDCRNDLRLTVPWGSGGWCDFKICFDKPFWNCNPLVIWCLKRASFFSEERETMQWKFFHA